MLGDKIVEGLSWIDMSIFRVGSEKRQMPGLEATEGRHVTGDGLLFRGLMETSRRSFDQLSFVVGLVGGAEEMRSLAHKVSWDIRSELRPTQAIPTNALPAKNDT